MSLRNNVCMHQWGFVVVLCYEKAHCKELGLFKASRKGYGKNGGV